MNKCFEYSQSDDYEVFSVSRIRFSITVYKDNVDKILKLGGCSGIPPAYIGYLRGLCYCARL